MLLLDGQNQSVQERLASELAEVESRFTSELMSDLTCVNSLVGHVERYRGKMLRPMLVLVSGMAAGANRDNAEVDRDEAGVAILPLTEGHRVVAAVVEMVHMATLVHDDVLDDAEVRRRGSTVNALNGNEAAVMLGDYLISHSYHLCSSLDQDVTNQVSISRVIADTTNTVCEGELLQLANRNNWDLDEGTYFEIIRRKTASLTGISCKLGAVLHGDQQDETNQIAEALYCYGEQAGIAFQVIDDLLDLVGDQDVVGKSLGRDLAKGKLTLPMIRYLSQVDAAERTDTLAQIQALASMEIEDNEVAPIIAIRERVLASDAIEYARNCANQLVEQAKASLDVLPPSSASDLLRDMADMILKRHS
jgi:octaprenyl-diphosphate synthase